MVDISQFGNVFGLAVFLGLVVQFAKPKLQTIYVPYFAVGLGVVLALVFAWGTAHLATPADIISYAVGGFLAGLLAVGGYETTIDKIKLTIGGPTIPK